MATVSGTLKKEIKYISPQVSHKYCVICLKDITLYKKPKDNIINLWSRDGTKTDACQQVELYLRSEISEKGFKIVCKACHRSLQTGLKRHTEKEQTFLQGRKKIEEKYTRTKIKRCLPSDVDIAIDSDTKKKNVDIDDPRRRRRLIDSEKEQQPDNFLLNIVPEANGHGENKMDDKMMVSLHLN